MHLIQNRHRVRTQEMRGAQDKEGGDPTSGWKVPGELCEKWENGTRGQQGVEPGGM